LTFEDIPSNTCDPPTKEFFVLGMRSKSVRSSWLGMEVLVLFWATVPIRLLIESSIFILKADKAFGPLALPGPLLAQVIVMVSSDPKLLAF